MTVDFLVNGKKVSLNQWNKAIEKKLWSQVAEQVKPSLKTVAEEAILALPTTGSGFTAKKTVITSGGKKATLSRSDTKSSRAKLGRRRHGNSTADRAKSINTAKAKIERMKTNRIAFLLQKGRPLMRITYGSYYAHMIVPRNDPARRRLPKIVEQRLRSKLK